jgi:hypothetical protein
MREELSQSSGSSAETRTTGLSELLHEQTILGGLCSMDMSITRGDDARDDTRCTVHDVIRAALEVCPEQVRCSQRIAGHTPLRDAVCNPTCLPAVLEILVQADQAALGSSCCTTFSSGVNVRDQYGLTPLDHLLHTVQLCPRPGDCCAVAKLESLLKHARPEASVTSEMKSPLLHLLSLGNSFVVLPGAAAVVPAIPQSSTTSILGSSNNDSSRLHRILDCTRLLLGWNPSLIHVNSRSTSCSPLHVAIRNYGNFAQLVRELIERDVDGSLMRHRNIFGDLPLHVACSVGVPMDIMRLVLARTLMASGGTSTAEPHALVWSTNSSGYTPVDLEWIRHIEAGNGFFSHRSFYPLEARGIRRPGGRCDALYDVLLRQAVDQVLGLTNPTEVATDVPATATDPDIPDSDSQLTVSGTSDGTVGLLLHRILLVVRASFGDSFSRSPFDLSGDILHQAAALCGPNGPVLPRPVLELILWQHPEQVERRDHTGKLPLHYAVQLSRLHEEASFKSVQEWKLWVHKLLFQNPDACCVKDNRGRLPLHHALDYHAGGVPAVTIPVQEARNVVVRDLVGRFPQSVELVDPVTKLYPFQLAAMNPLVSLDTVYLLLRMCPGAISHCTLGRDAQARGDFCSTTLTK